MAVPKRTQLANKCKATEKSNVDFTDYSKFLALDYDYKSGILHEGKHDLYFELRDKYGNK